MHFWLQEAAAAAAAEAAKTLAEISDRYGAPNLSRVEELDEPVLSDVSILTGGFGESHIFSLWEALCIWDQDWLANRSFAP